MKTIRQILLSVRPVWSGFAAALLLSTVVLFQSGCIGLFAGAAVGVGSVAYVRGELRTALDQDYDRVVRAAGRAVEQLRFVKVSENQDALTTVLIARTAEDTKVEIRVVKVSEKLTRVEIRVGVFGDQAVSQIILGTIKDKL